MEEEIMGEKYICKEECNQQADNCVIYMEPLLIDYSLLISSSSSQKSKEELEKFTSALTSWGCLQLINHGIPTSLLDEIREVSRLFIALPIEEKQKYAMSPGDINGYGGLVDTIPTLTTTTTAPIDQVVDWNEGINLTVFPEDRRRLKFWPENPLNFKEVLHEYTRRVARIFDDLFKLVIQSLNVNEESVANQYGKNKECTARMNFYPKCPAGLKNVIGLKPHADFSTLTLNLQDEEGLQVLKDEQWFMVPVIPHALVLNLGDPIEIMSNGILKSAVHRVVMTNTEKERISVAVFWDTDRNGEIGPLDELVTIDRPQLYQRVSLKDYVTKFANNYQSGEFRERPINALKI